RVHAKVPQEVAVGQIRRHLGTVVHELARHKECQIEEGHLMLVAVGSAAWAVSAAWSRGNTPTAQYLHVLLRPSVRRTLQRSMSLKRGSSESAGTRRDGVLQEVPLARMQQSKVREWRVYRQAGDAMVVASQEASHGPFGMEQGKVKQLRYSVSRS